MTWNDEGINPTEPEIPSVIEKTLTQTNPTLTIIGVFRGGKLVRVEWNGQQVSLSDRTLNALTIIGLDVIDKTENYLFNGADVL